MRIDNIVRSIPDERDFIYQTLPGPYAPFIDLKPKVYEVEDQLSIGSCTANATMSACEQLVQRNLSRLFPYWVTRNLIDDIPFADGATMRGAVRAVKHFGSPDEAVWPYDIAQVNTRPSDAAFGSAKKATRYERIPSPATQTSEAQAAFIDAIKSALSEGLPVIFASYIGAEIKNLRGPWQTHKMRPVSLPPFNNSNTWIGNHAMLIIGYDDNIQNPCPGMIKDGSFLVQNSWGKEYGDGGFFGYPYAALTYDIMEAWIIRGFDNVEINPPVPTQYVTSPAEVLKWYWQVYRRDVTDPLDENVQFWAKHPEGKRAFLNSYKTVVNDTINKMLSEL